MYNHQQIAAIVKTQIKEIMKKSEWARYVDDADSNGKLMETSLVSLGLDSLDVSETVMFVENELGVTFDDADFTKLYSQMTVGDIVNIATKNYDKKHNNPNAQIRQKPVIAQLAKSQKVIDAKTIEQTVARVFKSFGITATDRDKTLRAQHFDFMDALSLMNDIDRAFNLPNGCLSEDFDKKHPLNIAQNGFVNAYNEITYNDIVRFLCTRFNVAKPVIVNTIIMSKKQKEL